MLICSRGSGGILELTTCRDLQGLKFQTNFTYIINVMYVVPFFKL